MQSAKAELDLDVRDVEYLRHGDLSLQATVYRPAGQGPFPLMIQLHGGAWCLFDRRSDVLINEPLARSGVIVVAIDFRMPPVASYPASFADINYAVRWAKMHADELGTRSDWIGIMGSSSGGHQAMLTGMRPRDGRYAVIPLAGSAGFDASVSGVALCSPVIDPIGRYEYARRLKAAGPPYPESTERWITCQDQYWKTEAAMEEGSPSGAIERGEELEFPPVLYINGTADVAHPRPHLDRFVKRYREAGGRLDLHLYEGEAEGFMTRKAGSRNAVDAMEVLRRFVHNTVRRS